MASQKLTYLIVGGCGFLGHHIVKLLQDEKNINVAVMDLRTDRYRFPGVEYYDGDITSAESVNSILQKVKPQVLINTASPLALQENRPLYLKVNVHGTENLIECAGKSGFVKAFVFTSSASIVHDGIHDMIDVDESVKVLYDPEQPEYYAHTKAMADKAVLEANRKYGDMLTCTIRPSGIYGEGDFLNIPGFLTVMEEGKHKWQVGDNTNLFDWTYVGNVAHAHILAAKALLETSRMSTRPLDHEKVDGEAFFVTNDDSQPFWNFARQIWRAGGWTGKPEDAWVIPRGLGMFIAGLLEWIYWLIFFGKKEPVFKTKAVRYSTMSRTFDISKAKKRLGYSPIVGQEEGVKRGVDFYVSKKKQDAESNKTK